MSDLFKIQVSIFDIGDSTGIPVRTVEYIVMGADYPNVVDKMTRRAKKIYGEYYTFVIGKPELFAEQMENEIWGEY